jgi:hypothetical protein
MSVPDSDLSGGRAGFVRKQSANVYTMMLIVAFIFILLGCLFLYLMMKTYGGNVKVPSDAKAPVAVFHKVNHAAQYS